MLAPNPALMSSTVPAPKWHDVTIVRKRKVQLARVQGVPPEEFGIAKNAKSIKTCGYCFHRVLRSQSELIAEGYDEKQVTALPSYTQVTNQEEWSRDTVAESMTYGGDQGMNQANRQLWITEHYIRMDYEGKGKARLYRVTTGGSGWADDVILRLDGEEQIIEIDAIPFAAMTPVIMTHRFFGRSIADLVMDIQRIKTALLRSLLDNAYIANNPRTEVSESHATENTLDDLLISRPGGIVRTKVPGGLQVLQHPDIGVSVFPLLQYQDATREWRTGVSRQGQGTDPNALQNQVATIANQMFTAAQAKMKLIARIFAETGVKDMFSLLHSTIRRHGSQAATVRLRNQWVNVDPRSWKMRDDMNVNVGLGTGSKAEQLQQLQLLISAQERAIQAGMVSPKNLWNSAQEMVKLMGRKDPESFFTRPGLPPDPNDPASAPIQPPSDPKMQIEQMKAQNDQQTAQAKIQGEAQMAQMKGQLEQQKMQADATHQAFKNQAEAELAAKKHELDVQKAAFQAELDRQKAERDHQYKLTELNMKQRAASLSHADGGGDGARASIEVRHGAAELTGPLASVVQELGQHMAAAHTNMVEAHGRQMEALTKVMEHAAKPRRLVRDAKGRATHSEVMN